MSKAPQLGKSLGKVSILGVESLLPFSAWLLLRCKNTPTGSINLIYQVKLIILRSGTLKILV